MRTRNFTAIIEREDSAYVSLCPELGIASQGNTVDQAKENLREAIELFLDTASPDEVASRLHDDVYITRLEVAFG